MWREPFRTEPSLCPPCTVGRWVTTCSGSLAPVWPTRPRQGPASICHLDRQAASVFLPTEQPNYWRITNCLWRALPQSQPLREDMPNKPNHSLFVLAALGFNYTLAEKNKPQETTEDTESEKKTLCSHRAWKSCPFQAPRISLVNKGTRPQSQPAVCRADSEILKFMISPNPGHHCRRWLLFCRQENKWETTQLRKQ